MESDFYEKIKSKSSICRLLNLPIACQRVLHHIRVYLTNSGTANIIQIGLVLLFHLSQVAIEIKAVIVRH